MKKIVLIAGLLMSGLTFGQNQVKNLKPQWEPGKEYKYKAIGNVLNESDFENFKGKMKFNYDISYKLHSQKDNIFIVEAVVPNFYLKEVLDIFKLERDNLSYLNTIQFWFSYDQNSEEILILNWEELHANASDMSIQLKSKLNRYPTLKDKANEVINNYIALCSTQESISDLFFEQMNWFTNGLNKNLKFKDEKVIKSQFVSPIFYSHACKTEDHITYSEFDESLKKATFSNTSKLDFKDLKTKIFDKLKESKKNETINSDDSKRLLAEKSFKLTGELKEIYEFDYEQTIPLKILVNYIFEENSDLGKTKHETQMTIQRNILDQ